MKKIFCILIIITLFLFTACTKKVEKSSLDKIIERDLLIVGIKSDSKPFCFKSRTTGSYEGFDVDIARNIAKDIVGNERKIKFVEIPPEDRIESVLSEQVDMVIATMTITPQRQFLTDFSAPYYIAGQTAVVKEDSDIKTFTDLKRKTIIVVLGTTAEQNIRRIIPMARILGYKDYKSAFDALLQGKGDAVSTDDTIIMGFLIDNKGYRMLPNKISQEPYGICIKQNDDRKLKTALDITVTRMKKDGTIKELKRKWHLL